MRKVSILEVTLYQFGKKSNFCKFTLFYERLVTILSLAHLNFFYLVSNVVNPAGIYLFKVNNRNTRTMGEICSKLTIKIPERRHWHCSVVLIFNFEQISRFFPGASVVELEQVSAGWEYATVFFAMFWKMLFNLGKFVNKLHSILLLYCKGSGFLSF